MTGKHLACKNGSQVLCIFGGQLKITSFIVPALLHVNKEFRLATLKSYQLAFSSPRKKNPIYFNFSKERLAVEGLETLLKIKDCSSASAWKKVENQLRFLIIRRGLYHEGSKSLLPIIASFNKLESFVHQDLNAYPIQCFNSRQANRRLRMTLENNWSKSHEYEELVASSEREASLVQEPLEKKVYVLPKVEVSSLEDMTRMFKRNIELM
ncbi:hypothetical protein ONS95_007155 [Cadophora gregata]|uniref:uncharacterized protein n=1 Tax=Cadophora gregata TaxID=51156 RepID=UPI0026DB3039|nr:uncharacterized protein ONS95_007155 [Cadophora gregata]KAK0100704.1 hypothetical protein ONS95_007155 [Cadophora gregata]KAK0117299.1 hypothetical protein ONS96_013132 [Cadophora gregata f. sp. sojae]